MVKVTAIGNPVYDLIKTDRVETDGRILSGCSTNFCLALTRLGVKCNLVGNIGSDYRGRFMDDLKKYGVGSKVYESAQSGGFSLRYFGDKGERELTLLGDAGTIDDFPEHLLDSDWIFLGPILNEIGLDYIEKLRQKTQARFFLDPQGVLRYSDNGTIEHRKTDEIEKIVSMCEIVKPNELECRILTGIDPREDYRTPAEMIKSWGAGMVVITLAEQGSVVYDGEEFYKIDPFKTDAVDPTGAGDTYAAGFMYGILRGYALPDCGILGSAVSSVMIENTGPEFELTKSMALDRMKEIVSYV